MSFRIGQKVVCVKPCNDLVFNRVYTVLNEGPSSSGQMIGVDQTDFGAGCPAYFAFRFRPLVERKTDISIFTKMLKPQRVDA